ncbi:MAG TPA: recombinase family protein [Streptomyces sp.]|nr:recombinase family protein [Streptomyces sp.]
MQRVRDGLAGLRAGLYARKSAYQGKKKRQGESVREQLDLGRAHADELGANVVEEFIDDDRSASTYRAREREEFERMIDWIESGKLDIVIAWSSTRLQRDIVVYGRLREACRLHGVLWSYGGKIYDLTNKDDRFRTGLDALIGEREVDEMRDNVLRTLRANAIKGKPHGHVAYGYRRVYDKRTGDYLYTEEDPEQAPVVRELKRRVGNGEERTKIARAFNLRGITPPAGHWRVGMVRRLAEWHAGLKENEDIHPDWVRRIEAAVDLREEARARLDADEDALDIARDFNKRDEPLIMARWLSVTITAYAVDDRYLGRRRHHGKVTNEEAWPALVTPAVHLRAVQAVEARKKSRKYNQRPGRAIHWLSAIMKCDICEIRVNSDRQHGLPRYSCQAPAAGDAKGYHASAQVSIVDPYVEGRLFEWLASPSFRRAFTRSDDELLREAEDAEAAARLLRAELEEFYELAGKGQLSARALAAVEAEKLPKIEEAEQKAQALGVPTVVRDLVGLSEDKIAEAWKGLDLGRRRKIAETLLEVRLKPQGPGNVLPAEQFVSVVPKQLARPPRKAVKAA